MSTSPEELVEYHLMQEMRAEGHVFEYERGVWIYEDSRGTFQITIKAKKWHPKKRLVG